MLWYWVIVLVTADATLGGVLLWATTFRCSPAWAFVIPLSGLLAYATLRGLTRARHALPGILVIAASAHLLLATAIAGYGGPNWVRIDLASYVVVGLTIAFTLFVILAAIRDWRLRPFRKPPEIAPESATVLRELKEAHKPEPGEYHRPASPPPEPRPSRGAWILPVLSVLVAVGVFVGVWITQKRIRVEAILAAPVVSLSLILGIRAFIPNRSRPSPHAIGVAPEVCRTSDPMRDPVRLEREFRALIKRG